MHEEAFGLADDVAAGQRGVKMVFSGRAGQCHCGVLGQNRADFYGIVGEDAGFTGVKSRDVVYDVVV